MDPLPVLSSGSFGTVNVSSRPSVRGDDSPNTISSPTPSPRLQSKIAPAASVGSGSEISQVSRNFSLASAESTSTTTAVRAVAAHSQPLASSFATRPEQSRSSLAPLQVSQADGSNASISGLQEEQSYQSVADLSDPVLKQEFDDLIAIVPGLVNQADECLAREGLGALANNTLLLQTLDGARQRIIALQQKVGNHILMQELQEIKEIFTSINDYKALFDCSCACFWPSWMSSWCTSSESDSKEDN